MKAKRRGENRANWERPARNSWSVASRRGANKDGAVREGRTCAGRRRLVWKLGALPEKGFVRPRRKGANKWKMAADEVVGGA